MKALHNVALQNRKPLDQLLAAQGGVCHVIGDTCFDVPDITCGVSHLDAPLILNLET